MAIVHRTLRNDFSRFVAKRSNQSRLSPFECGFRSSRRARHRWARRHAHSSRAALRRAQAGPIVPAIAKIEKVTSATASLLNNLGAGTTAGATFIGTVRGALECSGWARARICLARSGCLISIGYPIAGAARAKATRAEAARAEVARAEAPPLARAEAALALDRDEQRG